MTSRSSRLLTLLTFVFICVVADVGCGNYSNEDLEFMNALPTSSDLTVEIPAALAIYQEAELARDTHDTTRSLNRMSGLLVGLVDAIRSYPPTSRTSTSRIWGPFGPGPTETKNLGWQRRLIVSLDAADPSMLDFDLAVHLEGSADTTWQTLLLGSFAPGRTVRQGLGHLEVRLADARAAGYDASDWGTLDHLEISYSTPLQATDADPISVHIMLTSLPTNVADPTTAPKAEYQYLATDAQGQMTFDEYADVVTLTPQIEHVNITSQWLSSGQGRAQLTVVSGDGAGLQQTECWDRFFRATYNVKPWATGEQVGSDPSVCPTIPLLSVPVP